MSRLPHAAYNDAALAIQYDLHCLHEGFVKATREFLNGTRLDVENALREADRLLFGKFSDSLHRRAV